MNRQVCRDHLIRLLDEEIQVLARLERLLDREHELLVANDLVQFEQLTDERQQTIGALVRLEDERRALCRMIGLSPDLAGLERLLAWCDPSGSLAERMRALMEGASRCRDLNDRNGALVTARLHRVQTLLKMVNDEPASAGATYGPRGAFAAYRSARVLNTEI